MGPFDMMKYDCINDKEMMGINSSEEYSGQNKY
jgi:hypothetical protein